MLKKCIVVSAVVAVLFETCILNFAFAKMSQDGIRSGTIQARNRSTFEFPHLAKIGFVQAVTVALKEVRGDLLKVELKVEDGFLVYNVGIVTPGKCIMQVRVDAGSGEILAINSDSVENPPDNRSR